MSKTFTLPGGVGHICTGTVSTAVIAGFLLAGGTQSARAERESSELLAGYITASDVSTNPVGAVEARVGLRGRETSPDWSLYDIGPRPRGRLSEGERWEKFEAEFGVEKKSSSLMKGALEEAKYRLDSATFAMHDLVKNVEERFRFEYQLRDLSSSAPRTRGLRPMYSNPFEDMIDNARLRSDVDLNVFSQRAFVGLRLVMPFGD